MDMSQEFVHDFEHPHPRGVATVNFLPRALLVKMATVH